MLSKKGISVIIPNYNGISLLPEILPPLYEALSNTKLPYEIIISDDCSTDNSFNFIKNDYPEIIILKSNKNNGFSPTINKGIFAAQFDLLLLLNSDVKLMPDYFETQLQYFDKPDTFGVMGRIVGWNDDRIQDGGKYPLLEGVKIKTSTNFIPKDNLKNDHLFSMYLSGANALVSKEKIITLGGFDELFAPFYIEDVELSLRAWRMGWKCYYEHNAVCRHKTSVTIKSKESKHYINTIYYRNKMFLHAIHLSGIKLFFWYLTLLPETFIHLFTGRFYYFSSLRLFFNKKKSVEISKIKFAALHFSNKTIFSVAEVTNLIKNNLFKKVIINN